MVSGFLLYVGMWCSEIQVKTPAALLCLRTVSSSSAAVQSHPGAASYVGMFGKNKPENSTHRSVISCRLKHPQRPLCCSACMVKTLLSSASNKWARITFTTGTASLKPQHWQKRDNFKMRPLRDLSLYMLKAGEREKTLSLKGRDLSYYSLRQWWFIFSNLSALLTTSLFSSKKIHTYFCKCYLYMFCKYFQDVSIQYFTLNVCPFQYVLLLKKETTNWPPSTVYIKYASLQTWYRCLKFGGRSLRARGLLLVSGWSYLSNAQVEKSTSLDELCPPAYVKYACEGPDNASINKIWIL